MSDRSDSTSERREVCFSEAAHDGEKTVLGIRCERTLLNIAEVEKVWSRNNIALLADTDQDAFRYLRPDVFIDGVMAKRNMGTDMDHAPLVIGLGPGFCAGKDCHYVIETNPNSDAPGSVIDEGNAEVQNGIPLEVEGLTRERLIISPSSGRLQLEKDIGSNVNKGEVIGYVGKKPLTAPISGFIWGIIRSSSMVSKGQKLGDINPKNDKDICFRITPQARAIGGGVLEAILRHFIG